MSFTRINNSDFNGKGALSLPDQPTVAAQELKRKFDEPAREVVAPKVNVIVDELEATTAASDLGATAPSGRTGATVQTVLDNVSSALSNVEAVIPGLVADEHSHLNKAELDKFSEDASGKPLYDGNVIGETDYNSLDNQPQVNGVTLTGNKSASDLGLAATSDIPTKVSDLTNDSNFATTSDVATAVATKSNVAWNQLITTGQKIATLSIDGTPTDVFAPTGGGGGGGGAVDSVNGQTGTVVLGVNDIDDVTLSSVAPNDALVKDASGWKNKPLGDVAFTNSYNDLDDLPDIEDIGKVNISSPADGQILKYNATNDEWQNANGGGGGGMLPYLYIDSEAGATVTVNQPDSTVITPTAAGSGHWECELTGGYGTYVIHSVLAGQGDATKSLPVDTVMEYHVTDTHYDHTVSFVAPSGSTVRIEGGTEIYTLTGTGSTQTQAVHSASTSFTVTATMDGNGKPYTFTTPSTTGQTTTIPSGTFDFGTINVSVGADFVTAGSTITCVNGGTSCTPKTAASTLVFRVPTTGTWTISGSVSGTPYSVDAEVTSLAVPVSRNLETVPDGSTVLPTDVIQTWLNCAGIYDKTSYTTLADVLSDSTTLLALMSDSNAVDYMVRSKTFINAGLVPTMTDDTHPSGEAICLNYDSGYEAYKAFDNDESTYWSSTGKTNTWIGYVFPSAVIVRGFKFVISNQYGYSVNNYKIEKSTDNGSTWNPLYTGVADGTTVEGYFSNDTAATHYRLFVVDAVHSYNVWVKELQFFAWGGNGITEDSTAMTDIGANNYCADTLLDDEDWVSAIVESEYAELILNITVPIMTDDTHPSGEAFMTSTRTSSAYQAFTDSGGAYAKNEYDSFVENWVGYDFESGKIITVFKAYWAGGISLYSGNLTVKIQGSNTDKTTGYVDLFEETIINADPTTLIRLINNHTAYRYYRILFDHPLFRNSSYTYTILARLQFYGREDVDETVFNVYSAANDTVSITGNGVSLTCTTDLNGHGTIAKSSLPAGTYTFTSSVALDPDNLDGSHYYSKQITIHEYDLEINVMPDDALYWWGYKGDIEELTTASGWTAANGYALTGVNAFNTNDAYLSCVANSSWTGFSSKNIISYNKINIISKNTGTPAGVGSAWKVAIPTTKVLPDSSPFAWNTVSNSMNLRTYSTAGNTYIAPVTGDTSRDLTVYALWYE